jgi:hypothetical protein
MQQAAMHTALNWQAIEEDFNSDALDGAPYITLQMRQSAASLR